MSLVRLPAQTSLAAPSLHDALPIYSTVSGLSPSRVRVGGWVSTTLTVRVLVSELPFPWATVYVRVSVPTGLASTLPEAWMALVRVPEQTWLAVVPGSVGLAWTAMVR